MFARLFAVASLAAVAFAQCNTGEINCCNSVQQANDANALAILSTLGIATQGITGLVGFGCSPLSAVGTGSGAQCTQQPVCCTDNKFNGLVNVGCSPVNANL